MQRPRLRVRGFFIYQAIVRNTVGEPLVTQDVIFLFSIIKTTTGGTVVYTEKHAIETNQFGLVTLAIGNGTDKTGDFTTIGWGSDNYFLNVQIDKGDAIFVDMETTQLLSVPYAMHAKTVANYSETDPAVTSNFNFAGSMNTALIVSTQISDNETCNFAAKVCADYSVTFDGVLIATGIYHQRVSYIFF